MKNLTLATMAIATFLCAFPIVSIEAAPGNWSSGASLLAQQSFFRRVLLRIRSQRQARPASNATSRVSQQPVDLAREGWLSLFNGRDLTGWTYKADTPEDARNVWSVIDGVIDCNPKVMPRTDKSLYTEQEFDDYMLHVEWRIKETKGTYDAKIVKPDGTYELDENGKDKIMTISNADSGIYNRGFGKAQVNIWCWPIGSGEVYGYRNDANQPADVRAGVTPKENADKPVGQWNTFLITMKGDKLTVELNGKKVLDEARLPGIPSRGPIALQHHGGYDERSGEWNGASALVQFRNVYIKELD